jgi:hypothetical protein
MPMLVAHPASSEAPERRKSQWRPAPTPEQLEEEIIAMVVHEEWVQKLLEERRETLRVQHAANFGSGGARYSE